jgi:transposase-like protein
VVTCNRCEKSLPLTSFPRHSINDHGEQRYGYTCKLCKVEEQQLRQYGITTEQAVEKFGSDCMCCGITLVGRRIHIDHDHETQVVRGILCVNCNTGIGRLGDSVEGLLQAVAYLQR